MSVQSIVSNCCQFFAPIEGGVSYYFGRIYTHLCNKTHSLHNLFFSAYSNTTTGNLKQAPNQPQPCSSTSQDSKSARFNRKIGSLINSYIERCLSKNDLDRKICKAIKGNLEGDFSPKNEMLLDILHDDSHEIDIVSFNQKLKNLGVSGDKEVIQSCYDLAHRIFHKNIREPQKDITPKDYTLNFFWINLNPQDREKNVAQNIFGEGLESPADSEFAKRLLSWASLHSDVTINLWHDSALVTQKAQQKTFDWIQEASKSTGANLRLRDIRQLPNLTGEVGLSFHPGTPVYHRVDLLKALIIDYMMGSEEEGGRYCVVSDIDVEEMPCQKLFDEITKLRLRSHGYVLGQDPNFDGCSVWENQFFIFDREKKGLKDRHHRLIIEPVESRIAGNRKFDLGTHLRPDYTLDSQFVYHQYPRFLNEMDGMYGENLPRKTVTAPWSRFQGTFWNRKTEVTSEQWRFFENSNVPYTRYGRNYGKGGPINEAPIEELANWEAQPLSPLS